jgi:hypothetical protein
VKKSFDALINETMGLAHEDLRPLAPLHLVCVVSKVKELWLRRRMQEGAWLLNLPISLCGARSVVS